MDFKCKKMRTPYIEYIKEEPVSESDSDFDFVPVKTLPEEEQLHAYNQNEHLAIKRKRSRAQNWDDDEKALFLEYIRGEIDIVENKKKFSACNREKKGAWKRISAKLEQKGYSRDGKRLKEQWQRMKLQARRNVNAFKKRYNLVGAGPPPTEPTDLDWKIIDLIPNDAADEKDATDEKNDAADKNDAGDKNDASDRNDTDNKIDADSETTLIMPEVIMDIQQTDEPSTTGDIYDEEKNKTTITTEICKPEASNVCDTSTMSYDERIFRLNVERIQQMMRHKQEIHDLKMRKERMIMKYKEELFEMRRVHEIELHKEQLKLAKNGVQKFL